jgi:hypothetical protein
MRPSSLTMIQMAGSACESRLKPVSTPISALHRP